MRRSPEQRRETPLTPRRKTRPFLKQLSLLACILMVGLQLSASSALDPNQQRQPPALQIAQEDPLSEDEYLSFVRDDLVAGFAALRTEHKQAEVPSLDALNQIATTRASELAALPSATRLPPPQSIWKLMKSYPELRMRRIHEQIDVFGEELDPTDEMLLSWSESDETRRSLLDPDLDGFGVGAAISAEGETVIVVVYTLEPTALTDIDELERRVQFLVEQERASHRLKPLKFLAELQPIARAHSVDMGKRRFFDHDNPDGMSPGDRARQAGHRFEILAENLGVSYEIEFPIESIVQGWMESPGHRRNILDKRFTHTAVGVAFSESGEIYLTQLFSRPLRVQSPAPTRSRRPGRE